MSEKRKTDLINLKMIKKTEEVFQEELVILRRTTNFMRRITKISDKAVDTFQEKPNLRCVLDLFCRNRELVHFSIICMLNGGYAETKILSRVALENFLLIRLFNREPKLASDWLSNPERFGKDWKPGKVRKRVFSELSSRAESYAKFYGLLCDYTHPSFEGWIELMSEKKDGVYIASRPVFDPRYVSECIGLISWVALQSIKGFITAFKEWLTTDLVSEANELGPTIHQIVTRHFEVRIYNKEKMINKKM